jgi:hypothetical protein
MRLLAAERKPKTGSSIRARKPSKALVNPLSFAVRHAFLGRRILSELRILMRLAMSPKGEPNRPDRLLERDLVSY